MRKGDGGKVKRFALKVLVPLRTDDDGSISSRLKCLFPCRVKFSLLKCAINHSADWKLEHAQRKDYCSNGTIRFGGDYVSNHPMKDIIKERALELMKMGHFWAAMVSRTRN